MKTKSFKLSDETITLISTDLDDINVIPIQEYIIDIKKRVEINNHEVITLIRDLEYVYNKAKPIVTQGLEIAVNAYNKIGKAVAKSYDTKAKADDVNWFSIHTLCNHVCLLDDVHSTWETTMNHDEGKSIAGEVEYGGMNDSLMILTEYDFDKSYTHHWLDIYLDYVEFLND